MLWYEKIRDLKDFISKVGRLWTGTQLSGYAESGPYHCGNCRHLHGYDECLHPVVLADYEMKRRGALPVVNAAHGCCEFVEPKQ